MTTEYCQVCGCVVPFCKHTDGHAKSGPWLRVCHTPFTAIVDNLHLGSLEEAIEHCKATRKLNPEYPRVVLHEGHYQSDPIAWDSDEYEKQQAALLMMGGVDHPGIKPFGVSGVEKNVPDMRRLKISPRKKAEYKMVNPEIIPACSLMDIPAHVGKFVAMGFMLHADGTQHDNKTRTSLLVKIDIEAGYVETLNSIYWIV